ncbi:MAG: hypothetical protein FWG68_11125 [Defluviitaleaceae bacterium]|nr:hypothetical protein [Defluviitaleaceae bacterium]
MKEDIINNFLPDDDWADIVTEEDAYYLDQAEKDLATGNVVKMSEI